MPIGGVVVRHAQVGSQCSFVPCDLVGQVWFEVGEVMRDDASLCVILFVGRFPARDQVTSSTDLFAAERQTDRRGDGVPAGHA